MRSFYIQAEDINSLEKHLTQLNIEDETKSILFLMADEKQFNDERLSPLLRKIKKPLIGGIFPELIFNGQVKKTGVILLPLSFELHTQTFNLSSNSDDLLDQLEEIQCNSMNPLGSLFVFIDALSQNKETFMEALFNFFGMNTSYIGGGAGSLSFESIPCVINNRGIHSNSAVIGWGNKPMSLGFAHGWHSFSDVLKVTETQGNIVTSINWRPALDVYKEIVEEHSGMSLTSGNFSELAKSYPMGIEKLDAEMVVRDPFKSCSQGLHFVDAIQEGEYVRILHGDIESLIEGAAKAKDLALAKLDENMDQDSLFCIDCISRVLFMKESYTKELEVVAKNKQVSGLLTIGEIANDGDSFLEIFNKTIVLGVW
ncbi:FIST signal transduction protein [Ancylomarina sp. YFZ004]